MKIIQIIISIVIAQGAGLVGSIFTISAIPTWYAEINKPSFNPPGWIFGPVWILLYAMMGVSSYLIWQKWGESSLARVGIVLYLIHLALNAFWTILFFGLKSPGLAFIEIIVLWVMIVALIIIFYQIDKRAAYLLIPYILWVSFAAVLNYSIWQLN